jgi:hypothetical protein
MARRVKFKARGQKTNMEEVFAICLNQKRHDANGNRVQGHTFDEIAAMTPSERFKKLGLTTTGLGSRSVSSSSRLP